MTHSPYVTSVLLDDLRAAVALGVRRLLAYESGETQGLTDSMVAAVDALRVARKFGDTSRHQPKPVLSEQQLEHYVTDFATNEYGRQQAERALSRDTPATVADMWAWLNELGSYIPLSDTSKAGGAT